MLHYAVRCGNEKMVSFLLMVGADVENVDSE